MDYYNDYCIYDYNSLLSRLDSKGYLHQDVKIMGNFSTLGDVIKIYGHLNLDNPNLTDLGKLNYVKSDVWIKGQNENLTSLCELERVGGNLSINGSRISTLGKLKRVGGTVSIRDTTIEDLGCLEYVGGNLNLPNRFKNYELKHITVKGKTQFWIDKNTSKIDKIKSKFIGLDEVFFSNIHNQEVEQKRRVLNGKFLVNRCYPISEYNNFIVDNFNDFISYVDSEIEKFYGNHYSFYNSLYGELKSTEEINNEFPKVRIDKRINYDTYIKKLREESDKLISQNINNYPFTKYTETLNNLKKDIDWNNGSSTYWLSYNECELGFGSYTGDKDNSFIYYVENIIRETFSVFIDTLQNKFRLSKGLPKIGEGWISETDLYYKLKEYFSETEVIHHGRTKWLGKQHIDIWFPQYKIGVEYQGEQHHKPIDYFGGKESFIQNQKRDERKKRLFKENNSFLVEVLPNYNIDDVIRDIETIRNSI